MCFVTRNAKLSKFINNENFCKKEKKEIDRSRDVTGMVDNMHSNLTRAPEMYTESDSGLRISGFCKILRFRIRI